LKLSEYGILQRIVTLIFISLLLDGAVQAKVHFDYLNGSDLGMGIGARAIAMGGAFTAICDDASATFWNPAGLAQMHNNQLFLSGDYPKEFSSAGLVYRPKRNIFKQHKLALGISVVNHLNFQGDSGSDTWDGYAANLLYLAMVDSDDDFSGVIRSQTKDIRFSMGLAPIRDKRFLLGLNFKHIG
jgi:hypothetical protein